LDSAALYALAADRVLRPAPYLQYKNANTIMKHIKEVVARIKEEIKLPGIHRDFDHLVMWAIDALPTGP